mgnify:CR=1 FL=1
MAIIRKGSALTYATQIKNPVSRKVVFATALFPKEFYGWEFLASGTYTQDSDENIPYTSGKVSITEQVPGGDAVDLGAPQSSPAAVFGNPATTKGVWYWNWAEEKLYYKPKSGTTPYENFVLANVQFRWGNFGGEDSTSLPFEPAITTMPTMTLRTGQRFDAELGQTGSGSLGMANYQQLMSRMDIEPNPRIEIKERIDTIGGV